MSRRTLALAVAGVVLALAPAANADDNATRPPIPLPGPYSVAYVSSPSGNLRCAIDRRTALCDSVRPGRRAELNGQLGTAFGWRDVPYPGNRRGIVLAYGTRVRIGQWYVESGTWGMTVTNGYVGATLSRERFTIKPWRQRAWIVP